MFLVGTGKIRAVCERAMSADSQTLKNVSDCLKYCAIFDKHGDCEEI